MSRTNSTNPISPANPVEMYQFLHDVSRNPATEESRVLAALCEQLLDEAVELRERLARREAA